MPTVRGEQMLYSAPGAPGANNSAVLMDMISKLKMDLQKSRSENGKLVDQLNCLISLVRRAWSGDHGASMHLSNIVGVPPPSFETNSMPRNTPIPDKTRSVKNWERLTVRLLEADYQAIQQQIAEQQRRYIENRQKVMDEMIQDHHEEMSRFALHRQRSTHNIEQVDKKFFRCYSAKEKAGQGGRRIPGAYRPKSAHVSRPKTASELAEAAEMRVDDLLEPGIRRTPNQYNSAKANTFYRLSSIDQQDQFSDTRLYDDPSRYRHNNLFDPDVIFSPEMMTKPGSDVKSRPTSAVTIGMGDRQRSGSKNSVFMTEAKPERPLKYETTRPLSGKPKSASLSRMRRNSGSAKKDRAYSVISKKESLKSDKMDAREQDWADHYDNNGNNNDNNYNNNDDNREKEDGEEGETDQKPPISVRVKKTDPVDKFVEELKQMGEMEKNFKKNTLELQKKLGIDTNGFVY